MAFRTDRARLALLLAGLGLAAPGCATAAMRRPAAVLASAGERLETEAAAFTAARTAVVQLRQRGLVQRRQEVAEQGQYNARTLAQWKVASSEDRGKRLALFEAVVAGSEAMYEVRDQGLLWEQSVLDTRSALALDRMALHRFVRQLVSLSRPGRFVDGVKFYATYGAQVAAQVDAGLADLKVGIAAAQAAAGERPDAAPGGPRPAGPDGPTPTPPEPQPRPSGPDGLSPGEHRSNTIRDR